MQGELGAAGARLEIHVLGVNETGQESGNAAIVAGRTIPWLQETAAQPVWAPWEVTYRDVVILDEENMRTAVYNLTSHDLATPANYDSLKSLLLGAAQ